MSCNPRELKKLRRFPIPDSALVAGRERVRLVMAEQPFGTQTARWFSLFTLKPASVLLAVCALVFSSGGAVMASRGTVPGERLYQIKLISENVEERLAIAPAKKFAVQAAHAGRRLEETEKLISNDKMVEDDRNERIQDALRGYEGHLFSMNELAVRLSVETPEPAEAKQVIEAAENILDRHADLVVSATITAPLVAASVLAPIDSTLDLQDEVFASMGQEAERRAFEREGDGDHDVEKRSLKDRHSGRSKKIQERLRSLQAELGSNKLETR